jgi:copper resistance protein B
MRNTLITLLLSLFVVHFAFAQVDPTPSTLKPNSDWPSPVDDSEIYGFFLADLFEYNTSGRAGALEWDFMGWRGGDYNRFWFKSEGEQSGSLLTGGIGDVQALYGRMIAPFFDLQAGVEYYRFWGTNHSAGRFQAVLGLQGLSPYSFEIEPIMFISQAGDVSFRFTASQDFLFTQRAILQFRFETNAAIQSVEQFGIGSGFNDLTLGMRLRYEFRRELAPYIGVTWSALFGGRSSFEQNAGPDVQGVAFVAGIRAWY